MITQDMINQAKASLEKGIKVVSAPQLFPTPFELATRMVEIADLQPFHTILEPEGGTGHLVEPMINAGIIWENIHIVELNMSLCEVLTRKYRRVYPGDFLARGSWEIGGPFDRIVMNPPFTKGADIKHIKHAYSMLKKNGRLVSLCANGPRQQAILGPLAEGSGGYYEPLPHGSFYCEGTNVSVALLVIEG